MAELGTIARSPWSIEAAKLLLTDCRLRVMKNRLQYKEQTTESCIAFAVPWTLGQQGHYNLYSIIIDYASD